MVSLLEHNELTMFPQPFRIRKRRSETLDTFTLEIQPAKIDQAFGFAPGQFNMLYVFGVGEVPISICADPRSKSLMHTTRAVGPVTMAMSKLRRGDILGVRGPFGSSWPIEQLVRRRKKLGKLVFLYGARTPDDILYRHQLELWQHRGLQIDVTVDRALPSWLGDVGVVTTLIQRAPFNPANTVA